MIVSDLNPKTNLGSVKVEVPIKHRALLRSAGCSIDHVYIVSQWKNGIWVSKEPHIVRGLRFPLTGIGLEEILDWKVIEDVG